MGSSILIFLDHWYLNGCKALDLIKIWMTKGDDVRIIDLNRSGAERFEDANKVLQNEAFDHFYPKS